MTNISNTHTEKMRVNFIDTDRTGYIHYTAALRYFEVAEHQLMRNLLGTDSWSAKWDIGMPRVHVECDYKAPLYYPDEFECTARLTELGKSSLTYDYEIHRYDGILCITGKIVVVTVRNGETIPLPEAFRVLLEQAL